MMQAEGRRHSVVASANDGTLHESQVEGCCELGKFSDPVVNRVSGTYIYSCSKSSTTAVVRCSPESGMLRIHHVKAIHNTARNL